MALPGIARTDLAADKAVRQTRARNLLARDLLHSDIPIEVEFALQGTTNTGGVTIHTARIYVPDWAFGLEIHGIVEGYVDTGTGQWRINGGTWVDITQTTIGLVAEAQGTLGAGLQSVSIEAKGPGSGNTTYLRSQDLVAFWIETT